MKIYYVFIVSKSGSLFYAGEHETYKSALNHKAKIAGIILEGKK